MISDRLRLALAALYIGTVLLATTKCVIVLDRDLRAPVVGEDEYEYEECVNGPGQCAELYYWCEDGGYYVVVNSPFADHTCE